MINPIAFTIFNIDVRWYGILIATGIILGLFLCFKRAKKNGIDEDKLYDVVLVSILASIIGARLYYVIFSLDSYNGDIMAMINIRNGGLAIHGGLIFAMLAGYIMCKIKGLDFLKILDIAIPSVPLGQAIGRWGNFINQEAHGGPTDLPWGIMIDGIKVHPTFLYESIWCFLLFIFLIYFDNLRNSQKFKGVRFKGQLSLLYIGLYSIERFFVEGLRTDSLMIGPLRQAQVLSFSLVCISAIIYIILRKKEKENNI